MPKLTPKQPETTYRNAKPKAAPYKIADEEGLYMLVKPSGKKTWRVRFRINGKENTYSIGDYPMVSLGDARKEKDKVRQGVWNGIDPNAKKAKEATVNGMASDAYENVARQWFEKVAIWTPKHKKNVIGNFERDVFPIIGKMPIGSIRRSDIVKVNDRIEKRDALSVMQRNCGHMSGVFQYGMNLGYCETDPARGSTKYSRKRAEKNYPYLVASQLPDFMAKLGEYHAKHNGHEYIQIAMQLLMYTFVRPGELAKAEWSEFDIENRIWIIPAHKMKKKDRGDHKVPLSSQAVQLIARLKEISGDSPFLFPGIRASHKPISDTTLLKVIKLIGYEGKLVPHGARGTASTILNDNEFLGDAIERQLHHKGKNKVRSAYNHAEYMTERVRMMQWFGDYLADVQEKGEKNG